MKNNFIKNLISTLFVFILSSNSVFAKTFSSLPPEIKVTMAKFGVAMAGVFAFSFIIYIGLSLYNRFFVDAQIRDFNLRSDSLRSPKDLDESIMMFITKNRLK